MPQTTGRSGHGAAPGAKGLKSGSLGLVSSVVIGMSSTAPAYSLAASLGLVVASSGALLAGVKAPSIILLAFFPMYGIAAAYQELNRAEPDCGTTFTWASRAFGPWVGWMGGWGILAAGIIVMANLAQVAASYTFHLLGELGFVPAVGLGTNPAWLTAAGLLWIGIMTWICHRGIEMSARVQYVLLAIELVVLALFAMTALWQVYTGHAEAYSLVPRFSWFWPGGLDLGNEVAPALLTAVFIYWGWDTAVACNEETDDPGTTPGRAAVISTVLLLVTYTLVSVAAIAFAGVGTEGIGLGNAANSGDVFGAIGSGLFGNSALGRLGIVLLSASVLTSASASTQTTILPTARTALSMAAHGAFPSRLAEIHERFLTPTWATISTGVVSAIFYLLFTVVSTRLLTALLGSVGLMIAFYYGLTGFACAWFYRRTCTQSARHFLMRFLIPLLGGIVLLGAFCYALRSYAAADWLLDDQGRNVTILGVGAVAMVGIGALLVGLLLMLLQHAVAPGFFRGETLSVRSDVRPTVPIAPATKRSYP